MSGPLPATLRLAGFAAAVALVTSRLGLVVHELVGHGVAANAVGAGVQDVRLFWFAGGWIRYVRDTPWGAGEALVVQLGGIAIQLVGGAIALAAARGRSGWLRVALVGFGAGWVIHAAAYLAIGTYHGFGDGNGLHRVLGGWRWAVAAPAAVVAAGAAFVAARSVIGALAGAVPAASRARRLGAVAIALAVAAGLHAGLARGELAVRADATYGAIMKTERQRELERQLAAWLELQRAHGIDEREARARFRPTRRPPELPFGAIVVGMIALAGIAGAATSRREAAAALDRGVVGRAALAAVGAVVLVIAADAVFPL